MVAVADVLIASKIASSRVPNAASVPASAASAESCSEIAVVCAHNERVWGTPKASGEMDGRGGPGG